jgi:hypothetical protein
MTADEACGLKRGDKIVTDFKGHPTEVRIIAIERGGHVWHGLGHSQTGTVVRVEPPLCRVAKNDRGARIPGVPDANWYDIGWFRRPSGTQPELF